MAELPEGFGVEVGGLPAFQTQMAEQGLGSSAGLSAFREAGGRIDKTVWSQSWGEVTSAIANRDIVSALSYDQLPRDEHITDWGAVPEGMTGYSIDLQIRHRFHDEFGHTHYETLTEPTFVFSDEVVTVAEAGAQAVERWTTSQEDGFESASGDVVGFLIRGIHQRG